MPSNAVGVPVLDDDQPVVPGGDAEVERLRDGRRRIDRDDRRDRRHHLARLLLVQVEDAAEHPGLARVEFASHRRLGDQHLEVLGGRLLLVELFRPDTEEADHAVGQPGQRDGERSREPAEPVQGGCETTGTVLGPRDREQLRRLLADHDVQCGDQGVGDRDGDRDGDPVGEPAEDRLDQLGDGRFPEEADPDRGHRDSELAGGEVLVDVVELPEDRRGTSGAFRGELLELGPARADQRELGGDEDAVDRDQDEQQDEKDGAHLVLPSGSGSSAGSLTPDRARVLRGRSSSVTGDEPRLPNDLTVFVPRPASPLSSPRSAAADQATILDLLGQLEVVLGEAALGVGRDRDLDLAPGDRDVRMVVHLLGGRRPASRRT